MDIGDILRDLGVPWPEADETCLREAAQYWKQLAEACQDACEYGNRASLAVTDNNAGEAIDAFERYWNRFGDRKGALPLAAQACDELSKACDQCADEVSAVKQKIEHLGEAWAAGAGMVIVGAVGTIVTAGVSDATADTAAIALVTAATEAIADSAAADWIAAFGADLSTTLGMISEAAGDAIADTTSALASTVSAGGYGLGVASSVGTLASLGLGGAGGALLADPLSEIAGKKPDTGMKLIQDLLEAGAENDVGAVLGKLQEIPAARIASALDDQALKVATTNPQQFVTLTELARQVRGAVGQLSRSTLASIASQLIVVQHVEATNIISDGLADQLEKIAKGEDK